MEEQSKVSLIDIYEITYEPWWLSMWFKISLIIAGIAIFSAAAFFFYRKYRKKVEMPYWQKALADITLLEKQGFDKGEIFYVKLTHIIKDYFSRAYDIPLADKTDTEMLETLKHTQSVSSDMYQQVRAIFEGVMFIKFAHQQAATERMDADIKKSRDLIEATQQELKKSKQ